VTFAIAWNLSSNRPLCSDTGPCNYDGVTGGNESVWDQRGARMGRMWSDAGERIGFMGPKTTHD